MLHKLVRIGLAGLAMGLALTTGACLVTTDPQFKDPEKTPPVLVVDLATPDPRRIIFLDPTENLLNFAAFVESEDVGDDLEVRLLRDYGAARGPRPYLGQNLAPIVPAGHAGETDRLVTATWNDDENPIDYGCHRLTLMVTHEFYDNDGCPKEDGDYDAITWTVVRCDSSGCPPLDAPDACPPIEASCQRKPSSEAP